MVTILTIKLNTVVEVRKMSLWRPAAILKTVRKICDIHFWTIFQAVLLFHCVAHTKAEAKFDLDLNYNLHERPRTTNHTPLLIQGSINLRNILEVSEKQQMISLETTLRLYWKDKRITPKSKYVDGSDSVGKYANLNPHVTHKFWMPDIFIDQAKALRQPAYIIQPASVRVYTDSSIRYSSRINYDVVCAMDFHRFPLDVQICEIKFESFGLTSNQLQLQWMKNEGDNKPNHINDKISLAQFEFSVELMDNYKTDYYDLEYPGLIMKIKLRRQIGYHVVQTYIPSVVFVTLGWLSLFLPPESVPGRVGMAMMTMLTLTAMFSSVRQTVPSVSYCTYLDIWMVSCMIFVFLILLEFTIVTTLLRSGKKINADQVEKSTKIAVPILFLICNLIYWPNLFFG